MADTPNNKDPNTSNTPNKTGTDKKGPIFPTKQPVLKRTINLGVLGNKKQRMVVLVGAILIILVIVGITYGAIQSTRKRSPVAITTPTPTVQPTATPTPATRPSNLNGVEMPFDRAHRHPLAVMIENHIDARPQIGLADASIVYEAITEGGITRFMAVYGGQDLPERIGPVRSARQVFVDFAREYGPNSAFYAHVGGSPLALEKIRTEKVYDLDQFRVGAKAFKRYPKAGIATEHTMYAFPNKLLEAAQGLGYNMESNFTSWKFKQDTVAANRPESQTVTIPFSGGQFEVKYVYDKATNSYLRYMAGKEHKDGASGKHIAPRNVIVQFATYTPLPKDGKGTQLVGVIGSGNGLLFRDGQKIEIRWEKKSGGDRTIYTESATNKEVELNPGLIFVEIAPMGNNVTVQ